MKKNVLFLYLIVILSLFSSVYCIINLKNNSSTSDNKSEVVAKKIILRQENGYLQWKYDDNNSTWLNLLNISDLNGIDGKDGVNGKDGIDGKDGVNGKDGIDGKDGANGKDGIDGKDGVNGKDGIDGKDGVNGKDGIDGKSVEFRILETTLQYKYIGDSDDKWIDLIDISTIIENKEEQEPNIVTSVNGDTSDLGCYVDGSLCDNGTSMTVMVNETEIYNFYVLNDDGFNLTLISSENIGNDSINTVPWHAGSVGDNSNGPVTALETLITLTSDWSNIKEISNYTYINSGVGYKQLNIVDGKITIIKSNNESSPIDGVARARLLTYEEAYDLGCKTSTTTSHCPTWLYGNLDGINYSMKPYGYWLLTSYSSSKYAYNIRNTGVLSNNSTADITGRGIRPVITISKGKK